MSQIVAVEDVDTVVGETAHSADVGGARGRAWTVFAIGGDSVEGLALNLGS